MELILVDNVQKAAEFLAVHIRLNKDVPGWIRPLDKDIDAVFDPQKNKAFRHGECARWIIKDQQGNLIGRVAAFVNKKYTNKGDKVKVGGMGFFDCIDQQEAANLLFDTAKKWLQERGMEAMDGPINFGERNNWWGLLTQGYHEPLYTMNFNPPYYIRLFETYGFGLFFNQICYDMGIYGELADKFYSRHAAISRDPDFSAQHIKKNQLEKFAQDFSTIYNKAWAQHAGGKEMSKGQALSIFKQMKPLLDERIAWFAYYKGEPIAMWLNLPDLNQYIKHMNGKMNLWGKLIFLWMKLTKQCHKIVGIIFGVVPEFQGKGVDAYIILEGAKVIQRKGMPYNEYEMQWIGDFNPRMLNVATSLGAEPSRVLTTYRCMFDPNIPVERHPILK